MGLLSVWGWGVWVGIGQGVEGGSMFYSEILISPPSQQPSTSRPPSFPSRLGRRAGPDTSISEA